MQHKHAVHQNVLRKVARPGTALPKVFVT